MVKQVPCAYVGCNILLERTAKQLKEHSYAVCSIEHLHKMVIATGAPLGTKRKGKDGYVRVKTTNGWQRERTNKPWKIILTEEQVMDILTLHRKRVSYAELAQTFNTTVPNIHCIVTGKTWKRVYAEFYARLEVATV